MENFTQEILEIQDKLPELTYIEQLEYIEAIIKKYNDEANYILN